MIRLDVSHGIGRGLPNAIDQHTVSNYTVNEESKRIGHLAREDEMRKTDRLYATFTWTSPTRITSPSFVARQEQDSQRDGKRRGDPTENPTLKLDAV